MPMLSIPASPCLSSLGSGRQRGLARPRQGRLGWLLAAAGLGLCCLTSLGAQEAGGAATSTAAADFQSHGIPTEVAQARGTVSTVDGAGRDVVLAWLQDHRGGYSLLMVDALTGVAQQFEIPFPPGGDEPSAVLLSSRNRFYTLFNGHFIEFDPVARRFSFWRKTVPGSAMSLTEDRQGRVWAATYPDNRVLMFDPARPGLKVYGPLARERWAQYPRSIAADAQGWIYVGVGTAASQIYALDPSSGTAQPLLPADQRVAGSAEVLQSTGNSVFGTNGGARYLLSGGRASQLPAGSQPSEDSALVTGAQNLVARDFPSGRQLVELDLSKRVLTTRDAGGQTRRVRFRYQTQGAFLTQVCVTPQGQICGGTRFPMHIFLHDPTSGGFSSHWFPRQPNVIEAVDDQLYVAAYPDGILFTAPLKAIGQYKAQAEAKPQLNRPHALVVQQGGAQVIMAGTPEYGRQGGGMLFLNRDGSQPVTLTHEQLIAGQSTQAMIELDNGLLLGGTTTKAGTGGVDNQSASARLFLLDPASRSLLWQSAPVAGAQTITDLVQRADGLVYGIADSSTLFVFDPSARRVLSTQDFSARLGLSIFAQGTRAFVRVPAAADASGASPAGSTSGTASANATTTGSASQRQSGERIYLLFYDGIARIDPRTHTPNRVAKAPVEISVGGAYANGRIYFGSNSALYSWRVR